MKLNITVEGKTYLVEVEVADPEPTVSHNPAYSPRAAIPAPPASRTNGAPPASDVTDEKAIKSPLTGVVNAIEVRAGEDVAPDQAVVVLEAMKMLTTITSPSAAKIKQVLVAQGDAVKQGQVLVEFE